MPSDTLAAALRYAKYGWLVFPCHNIINGKCSCGKNDCGSPGKHPRTKNGLMDATTDENKIRQWWGKWPTANIAVRTGPESKIWVWDADLPDGPGTTAKMELPKTLSQQTGSGGLQFFFQWTGTEIKNSSKKVAPGIDIRGLGGYVILPPANHISGGQYQWTSKDKIAAAPGWLVHMVTNTVAPAPPPPAPAPITKKASQPQQAYDQSKYGQTALSNEIAKLSGSGVGQRNETLNTCAFNLAQLVAGGEIDESTVRSALFATALSIGLKETEARKTIDSGFRKGMTKPRTAPESNECHECHASHECHAESLKSPNVTESHADVTHVTPFRGRFNGNLTGAIRNLIEEFQGSFVIQDIDRELGLTDPADKVVRRQALKRLENELSIKKDTRLVGKYHILKTSIQFIDFDAIDPSPFKLEMPLGLSHMVRIPKKSLIVIAGSTNSGKTSLAIDFLKRNLASEIPLMYLMSEMGPSEYKQRITDSVPDLGLWKKRVQASDMAGGFDTVISKYNPDGLTVIDFLEEIAGEYFKIASDIRSIYDALGEGVAVVCLQKHSKADVGRGGEATAEKPRLYLSLDKLVYDKNSTISAVKIYKAKEYSGTNPNGLERHISFGRHGSEILPISDWMYCNAVQRAKWIQHYEAKVLRGETCVPDQEQSQEAAENGLCFYFKTQSGASVRIIERDVKSWRKNYKNINVDVELLKISNECESSAFLDDKKYFWQLSGLLAKKNQAAGG